MLVEMDVEEEEEEEEEEQMFTPPQQPPPAPRYSPPLRGGETSRVMMQQEEDYSPMDEEDEGDFTNIGNKGEPVARPPLTDAQRQLAEFHQQAIGRFPKLYIFAGMLANALGVDDLRQLLRHPQKGWGAQTLLPNAKQELVIPDEDKSTDRQYDFMLRSMFNAYTYGGLHRAYQRLRPEMPQEVTLRDLIISPVTSDTFAAFCALLSKSSTGAFAQQGRIYNGGGKIKIPNTSCLEF
jgi:hypothetical protein